FSKLSCFFYLSVTQCQRINDGEISAQRIMHFRAILILVLNLACLSVVSEIMAQDPPPTQYQIKAAFLFNFAKFVGWPSSTFSNATSPIVIGVLGENPFGDDLEKTIRDKTVDDRPLTVRQFRSALEATNSHILFISTSEKSKLPQILETLRPYSVL